MPRRVGMRAVSPPSPQHDRRREADVVPELQLPELPRSYPGYPLPHLSRTLVLVQLIMELMVREKFCFIHFLKVGASHMPCIIIYCCSYDDMRQISSLIMSTIFVTVPPS
eukprot:TRINITY_DN11614_c0_g1_i7.p1 TRINITY_DN11614_c0_g1~~TRINITY_DN11614_c0_g1_i7.p1  ORF type:complete len:110 (-),score=7.83 TRINITY_DN11614_c0_g1_i7:753-1082(-)